MRLQPIIHYTFDNVVTGSTIYNEMDTYPASISSATISSGYVGNCLESNSYTQYVSVASYVPPNQFTIAFWMYPDNDNMSATGVRVCQNGVGGVSGFAVQYSPTITATRIVMSDSIGIYQGTYASLTANNSWNHVAFVFDDTNLKTVKTYLEYAQHTIRKVVTEKYSEHLR